MVDGGKILSGSASELVTLVVTTSPIPSHPSLVLLRTLLNSFRKHLVDFENYNLLLVCDGFSRSDGKDQLCSKEAYQQFLDSVQELCASGELGNCQILELKSCHGYGLALSAALAEVVTEFVFVVQHDWLLVKDVDLGPVVNAMDLDATIKYVGLQSLTTLDYARRMQLRYNLQLPPDRHLCGLRLVPQLLWYDKPHLTRKKHYLEVVLPEAKMGVFQNPERRYGVDQMWPKLLHAENLEEEHLRHGTFFWDVGAEVVLPGTTFLAGSCWPWMKMLKQRGQKACMVSQPPQRLLHPLLPTGPCTSLALLFQKPKASLAASRAGATCVASEGTVNPTAA